MMDQDIPTENTDAETDGDWYTAENSTFGDRLAGAREAAGMSREQLARRMGLKVSTIDKWEEDLAEPRANRLQMLSGLLGVSLTWLLTARGEGLEGPAQDEPLSDDLRSALTELRQVRTDLMREADRVGILEKRLRRLLKDPAP
ncbi:helix-turn-helix domain-containing protein [Meridianimarinicoccus roseus]|nr:helix-turn-helix transcriptional regulator [Meridianimarinicoccus roseus]